MVAKTVRWSPDAVAADLEDAVAPLDKSAARVEAVKAIAALASLHTLILIRVNAPHTP
jgi:citrate lyase subunit beta/citryl-CoA lyase